MNQHGKIMNLPCVIHANMSVGYKNGYRDGHRDARHAAAELVAASEDVKPEPVKCATGGLVHKGTICAHTAPGGFCNYGGKCKHKVVPGRKELESIVTFVDLVNVRPEDLVDVLIAHAKELRAALVPFDKL